ncbi:unnamed protein product, partial [Mesorhabditis belari]|uniref:AB hydrolase-1 domain-containing protein n=1 Tax=Mesorhabditis belari TaxID=2138241 RepID=A0AAF3J994_9BILA
MASTEAQVTAPSLTTPKRGSRGLFGLGYYSLTKLVAAESSLLSAVAHRLISRFIPIRFKQSDVYTITLEPEEKSSDNVPIVLIHGFAAGSAVWCAQLEALAKRRTVHALDLLGFGRSSRPAFSQDETLAELEMVEAIEDWRKEMAIEKMTLVAHSFGGYLASSYTLEHPSRVKHLILADPWGFPEKPPPNDKQIQPYPWMHFVGGVLSFFNPLAILRVLGPYGPSLVKKLRPDLSVRYKGTNPDDIYNYIYHINAQPPTGETAFKSMTHTFGWAKRPMIRRFNGISENVPVTFIYGSKSWIDPQPAFEIQATRNGYVDIQIIRGAGHQLYADEPESFNEVVLSIIDKDAHENKTSDEE